MGGARPHSSSSQVSWCTRSPTWYHLRALSVFPAFTSFRPSVLPAFSDHGYNTQPCSGSPAAHAPGDGAGAVEAEELFDEGAWVCTGCQINCLRLNEATEGRQERQRKHAPSGYSGSVTRTASRVVDDMFTLLVELPVAVSSIPSLTGGRGDRTGGQAEDGEFCAGGCLLSETVPSRLVAAAAQWLCANEHLLYKCIGHHLFVMFLTYPRPARRLQHFVSAQDVTNTGACSHNKGEGKNKAITAVFPTPSMTGPRHSMIPKSPRLRIHPGETHAKSASDPSTVALASNWVFSKVIHACELNVPFNKKTPLLYIYPSRLTLPLGSFGTSKTAVSPPYALAGPLHSPHGSRPAHGPRARGAEHARLGAREEEERPYDEGGEERGEGGGGVQGVGCGNAEGEGGGEGRAAEGVGAERGGHQARGGGAGKGGVEERRGGGAEDALGGAEEEGVLRRGGEEEDGV
ncbi:hypothetical protein B0H14DRAFT_3910267 [Mycena olivaceomarginata]|nr:hypothetical protein B0H14DRAFT_3910267 [Mycena olivaceomarginata]